MRRTEQVNHEYEGGGAYGMASLAPHLGLTAPASSWHGHLPASAPLTPLRRGLLLLPSGKSKS